MVKALVDMLCEETGRVVATGQTVRSDRQRTEWTSRQLGLIEDARVQRFLLSTKTEP